MKKTISLILSLMVIFTLTGCKNNKEVNATKTVIQKVITTKTVSISDKNAYVKINSYKLNTDGTITWNINFLQDTENIGDVYIYTLIYDENGKPIKYHKVDVDPVVNSSFDRLRLIKDMKYPINKSYDFKSEKNTLVDYSKIKYCIDTVYYKDNKGEWLDWKNPNLANWIKENNN